MLQNRARRRRRRLDLRRPGGGPIVGQLREVQTAVRSDDEFQCGSLEPDFRDRPGPAQQAFHLEVDEQPIERGDRLAVLLLEPEIPRVQGEEKRIDADPAELCLALEAFLRVDRNVVLDQTRRDPEAERGIKRDQQGKGNRPAAPAPWS
ncbi:MAG: hypothetical protein AMJ64_02070 [Betaproteobacteria bacterium SG8_39]|nr:MAG: hypothetical protein AMJ64_02070 [Betaproteobacteria bacterium SG8_39]